MGIRNYLAALFGFFGFGAVHAVNSGMHRAHMHNRQLIASLRNVRHGRGRGFVRRLG